MAQRVKMLAASKVPRPPTVADAASAVPGIHTVEGVLYKLFSDFPMYTVPHKIICKTYCHQENLNNVLCQKDCT